MIGYFELRHATVEGWALDPLEPGSAVVVAFHINGRPALSVVADRYREDLRAAGIGNGFHAFECTIPPSAAPVHALDVFVANSGTPLTAVGTPDLAALNRALAKPSGVTMAPDPFADPAYLNGLQRRGFNAAEQFRHARPFPSVVLEDFLPQAAAEAALSQFPAEEEPAWVKFEDPYTERKMMFNAVERMPPVLSRLFAFLNGSHMMLFLEKLTGIEGLIPDPYYVGGGLHVIGKGGKLDIHADFNFQQKLRLDRRLNLLIYLNKDWPEEYGGHLELWNRSMTAAELKVLPVFNRCVVFKTTEWSFHGHPTPLTCPDHRVRRSIAAYYYSNGRPVEEQAPEHLTLWQERKGEG